MSPRDSGRHPREALGSNSKFLSTDFSKCGPYFSLHSAPVVNLLDSTWAHFRPGLKNFLDKMFLKTTWHSAWIMGLKEKAVLSRFEPFWFLEVLRDLKFGPNFGHSRQFFNISFQGKGPGMSPRDSWWLPESALGSNSKFLYTDFSKCGHYFSLCTASLVNSTCSNLGSVFGLGLKISWSKCSWKLLGTLLG